MPPIGDHAWSRIPAARLDVWRTAHPRASAPIWLTPDEIQAVLVSTKLGHWDHLRGGPGWRAADELPQSIIVEKAMGSILTTLARRELIRDPDWSADIPILASWHIGQG